jgi:two-component system sensor histidine kinase GlrK
MIENLLSYAEIQSNTTQLNASPQALKDLFDEILQAYTLTISNKNITIKQILGNIIVQLDTQKLRTVLDNLISNAVKFTPQNGEIHIQATQSKNLLTIEVKDSGPGIADANKNALFEPFYRGAQPNNSLVAGSGLGLFIAKEMVSALKGELSLAPSNTGAHFIIRLPIQG